MTREERACRSGLLYPDDRSHDVRQTDRYIHQHAQYVIRQPGGSTRGAQSRDVSQESNRERHSSRHTIIGYNLRELCILRKCKTKTTSVILNLSREKRGRQLLRFSELLTASFTPSASGQFIHNKRCIRNTRGSERTV